jgi:peroxiredoxin Q/BCP
MVELDKNVAIVQNLAKIHSERGYVMAIELKVGDKVPEFSLLNQSGEPVASSDYVGKPWAIYFYPKASTPGCTTQSCAVRDALPELGALGAAAVGISPDAPAEQKAFDDEQGLGFPLLCDVDHTVAKAFGVWGEKSMYGRTYMGIVRSAFLVGADGTFLGVWYKISPQKTVPSILTALKA